MTYREIFTYGNKLETTPDRIKFYSVFAMAGLLLGYGLDPFLYSKDYLVQQTKNDLMHFVKTDKIIEDTRFSFCKKENEDGCVFFTAKSRYVPYSITKVKCKGVNHAK